eukprot:TRINITY_DN2581_c0_g2_i1.p1 TRINITY_DN2581_c0_g2~~TRINITY_DN2581_c0_g2_i1.p1  ORF type:complete len:950 (-),score=151.13 TRINITY_DN2581_c0_g2_i1:95-2818(-)
MIKEDFPTNWQTLPQQLVQLITTQDVVKIHSALLTIRILAVIFAEPSTNNTRLAILNGFIEVVFPLLMTLFEYLLKQQPTLQISEMKLLLCKIFWSVTQLNVPSYFTTERFQSWMNIFLFIMAHPVPLPSSEEEHQIVSVIFLTKKWIARIFDRFFHRYSKQVHKGKQSETNKLALFFMQNYSLKILEIVLNLLSSHTTNNPSPKLPPKLTTACLNFVISSINPSHTWNVVKDHMEKLFSSVFFPILLITSEDMKLYNEDPHEFVKRQFDESIIMHDPRAAVLGFLADVIPLRGQEYLDKFMKFILSVLSTYESTPLQERNIAHKEAVLVCVGHLEQQLKASPNFSNALENFVFQHVTPELSSPHGILRARACWTFGEFSDLKYQNETHLIVAAQAVLECLVHPHLPVNVNAAITFPKIIQSPTVYSKFEPSLGNIIEVYLRLTLSIDNDELLESLQSLVKTFSSHIPKYAPILIKKLTEQYMRIISDKSIFSGKAYDSNATSMYTAIHCLNTIKTVMDMLENSPETVQQVLPYLQPLLMTMSPDLAEVILDYIHLMAQYSYIVPKIDDSMWLVFERLCQSCLQWAIDFLPEMFVPFDNFISKSADTFLQKNYLNLIVQIFQMSMEHKENIDWVSILSKTQSVMVAGVKLIQIVLFNCRGKIDSIIPSVIQRICEKLRVSKTSEVQAELLEVIAGALYSNVHVTLTILENLHVTRDVMSLWTSLLKDHIKSLTQTKCSIFGLSSFLYVNYTQLPTTIQEVLPSIIMSIIDLQEQFIEILREVDEQQEKEKNPKSTQMDSNEKPFILQKYADNEDIGSDIFGYPLTGPIIEKFEKMYEELSDDDDDTFSQDYYNFFGDIDELIYFIDALQFLSQTHNEHYHRLIQSLPASYKTKLEQQINSAQQRKQQ